MPNILIPSRNTSVSFPDTMSEDEISRVMAEQFPKSGQDIDYNINQRLAARDVEGTQDQIEIDLSNPIDELSLDDYVMHKKWKAEQKIDNKLGLVAGSLGALVETLWEGGGALLSDPLAEGTGQSLLQGFKAGNLGLAQLMHGVKGLAGDAMDYVTGQDPLMSKDEFLKKNPNATEQSWAEWVTAHKEHDAKTMDIVTLTNYYLKQAKREDIAALASLFDASDILTLGSGTIAKTLGKALTKGAATKGAQGALLGVADLVMKARTATLKGVEGVAKAAETVAGIPQAVKDKVGNSVAGGVVGAGLMANVGVTAGVLAGASTAKTGASLLGGAARAAQQGATRTGMFERMARDTTMSPAAQKIARGLATIQPALRLAGDNAGGAARGAVGGSVVGGALGYVAGGEEGLYSGIGSGIGIGGAGGMLGANYNFAKEAMGFSTSRTKMAAAGDIESYIASRPEADREGFRKVFNRLAEKSSLEQAAAVMDVMRIAEASGKRVRVASADEAKAYQAPGWANNKAGEIVLHPDRILTDTAAHEMTHLLFGETVNNTFRPEIERLINGLIDPTTGEVLKPGIFDRKDLAKIANDIADAYGDGNKAERDRFRNYAELLKNGIEPENIEQAQTAIIEEMTATYAGKFMGRARPGQFNPDRLPLAYRGALSSISDRVANFFRADAYKSGMDVNLGNITKAFTGPNGKAIRIPEMDAVIKKAFDQRIKGLKQENKILDLPRNQKDLNVYVRAYGLQNVMEQDDKGNWRPKTSDTLKAESKARWVDMVDRLQALSEEQLTGIDFSEADDGTTVLKARGQLSPEAIQAIKDSPALDQSSKDFLLAVLNSIGTTRKTLSTTYYGVYERGRKSNRMVAKVKEASNNEILPYSVEMNSKDGVLVRGVNMTNVRDRLAMNMGKPPFKGLFTSQEATMKAFRLYLDNLTSVHPIDSATLLGGGERGAKKRNMFYDALGIRARDGVSLINLPESAFTGRDKVNNIRSYRIERFTKLSPTGETFQFAEGTTYERAMLNFQPDAFTPETLPGGEASTNEQGWRILKRDGQKLFRVYSDKGEVVGVADTKEKAAAMALRKFVQVYHGSPHNFGRFTMQKIGTGEGAQAFGHGLYLAESKGVAGVYQKKVVSDEQALQYAKTTKEFNDYNAFGEYVDPSGEISEQEFKAASDEQKIDWLSPFIDEYKRKADANGNLYTVELNIRPEQMLDWDKPLSERTRKLLSESPEVQKAVDPDGYGLGTQITGSRVYSILSDKLGAKEASELLAGIGIPGIRYLDGNSRGDGTGTSNYVMFDDSLIRITAKNGKPVGKKLFRDVGEQGYGLKFQPSDSTPESTRYQPGAIGTIDSDGNPVMVKARDLGKAAHANHREITSTGNDDGSRDFRYNAANGIVYWWQPGAVSAAEKTKLADYLEAEGYEVKGHKNVRDDFAGAHGQEIKFQPSQLTARDINEIAAEVGGGELKGGAKAFGAFMRSMREKGVTLRDVVKSYGITLSSIQRQELKVETIKRNWPDAPFKDGEKIRPEDAFATLLGTEEGKAYLDDAERGVFNDTAATAMMQKFKSFGFHNKLKEQMQTAAEHFFPKAKQIVDAVNNMPPDEFIDFVRTNVKGISHGKIGFWSGQLGRGDLPTFDSRQGKLVYGKEVPVSKKVLLDQKERLPLLGIKVPSEYKDFAQTLLHHEVWDRINGSDTEHAPIKEAMLKFSPDPSSPDILNGSNGTRIIRSKSGKFRLYSRAGLLLAIHNTQEMAEKAARKKP